LVCAVITLTGLFIRTRTEEQNLRDRFGDAYKAYQVRTGRFFPKW
jgi:protein-S-isoprenylcysteine O-methyltransferase Ste14